MREIITACDGYKLSHHRMYPEGTQMVYNNRVPQLSYQSEAFAALSQYSVIANNPAYIESCNKNSDITLLKTHNFIHLI